MCRDGSPGQSCGAVRGNHRAYRPLGSARKDVAASIIVGSRARTDHPADAWSDLDVVLFAMDPPTLLNDQSWLSHIGESQITYRERTAVGIWEERRVLFADGCDVDFSILPSSVISELHTMQPSDSLYGETAGVINRGYRIIVDKDGHLTHALERTVSLGAPPPAPPTQDEFDQVLNDFWYHCVWITKKLRRGEVVVAHGALEGNQRRLLLQLLRWRAEQEGTIWHGNRFLEEWGPSRVRKALPGTWAHHNAADIRRALLAMMDLVSLLASELGQILGLNVPPDAERAARYWTEAVLNDLTEHPSGA